MVRIRLSTSCTAANEDSSSRVGMPLAYIDTSGVFLRDNPMVDSSRVLRSFLMDASGRVLVVGNPTSNDGVARSMIEAMTEESDQFKEQGRREDGDDA